MVASKNQETVNKKVHPFLLNRSRKVAERSIEVTQVRIQVTRVEQEKIFQGPEGLSQTSSFKVANGITGSAVKMAQAPV